METKTDRLGKIHIPNEKHNASLQRLVQTIKHQNLIFHNKFITTYHWISDHSQQSYYICALAKIFQDFYLSLNFFLFDWLQTTTLANVSQYQYTYIMYIYIYIYTYIYILLRVQPSPMLLYTVSPSHLPDWLLFCVLHVCLVPRNGFRALSIICTAGTHLGISLR